MRRAARGVGLTGVLVIGGVLYYTGAGGQMLDAMQRFDARCYSYAGTLGNAVGGPLCSGISYSVNGITKVADMAGGALRSIDEKAKLLLSSTADFTSIGDFGGAFQNGVARLTSSSDRLSQMVLAGPQNLAGGNPSQRFQQAIDSFSIGQHYMGQGSMERAMPWLVQGARAPEGYGLLSQLALGDMYRSGGAGVPVNPMQSQVYYQQAAQSLAQLSRNDSPQAQQLLQTLPASPQVIQQQIFQVIESLKAQTAPR